MSLTNRQIFKFGFLLRCADDGLTVEETKERIKQAAIALEQMEKQGLVGGLLNALTRLGWLGLGAGAIGGTAGGYTVGKMTEKETDPEEIKRQELIAAYQQEADRIRRAARRRMYRPAVPRRPSLA